MQQISAGLLMCRHREGALEFFLVHPGGPFYAKKNEGVWTLPKGLIESGEDYLWAAKREFFEETGIKPTGPFHALGEVKMKSGKIIHAWAFAGDWNESTPLNSNKFKLEWPPRSGKFIEVPEVDRAAWMGLSPASQMVHVSQVPFLERALLIFESL